MYNREERGHVFTDGQGRVFSIINCPPRIPCLPIAPDPNIDLNKDFEELRRPQFAAWKVPEAAFLLTARPVADGLLARLCVDNACLEPQAHGTGNGWILDSNIQRSWQDLEHALGRLCDLLIEHVNSPAASAISRVAGWRSATDCGYMRVHSSYLAARNAARRAREALMLLAARSSLAIALWEHKYPVNPGGVPRWITFLSSHNIHASWIDAIHNSLIGNLSHGLRVGAVVEVQTCQWLELIPVMIAAKVPVFFHWPSAQDREKVYCNYKSLLDCLLPPVDDIAYAQMNPPKGRPPIYALVRFGAIRHHPDLTFADGRPPHGPHQNPGETFEDFIRRMQLRCSSIRARQTQEEAEATESMCAAVQERPNPRSRVFVWVKAATAYPYSDPKWHQLLCRVLIHAPAAHGVVLVHPRALRHYNPYYDEWDLELPPDVQALPVLIDNALHPSPVDDPQHHVEDMSCTPPLEPQRPSSPLHAQAIVEQAFQEQASFVVHRLDMVHHWYGLRPVARTFPGVNYSAHDRQLHTLFGLTSATMPRDPDIVKCMVGWVWAITSDQSSAILLNTWDLLPPSSNCILRRHDVKRHLTVTEWSSKTAAKDELCTVLYELRYARDAGDLTWTLLTSASATLFLIRQLDSITTSRAAADKLVQYGIPFQIGVHRSHLISRDSLLPQPTLTYQYRPSSSIPSQQDYVEYMQRITDLLPSTSFRAYLQKGGIVWRILLEATGKNAEFFLERAIEGPAGDAETWRAIVEPQGDREIVGEDVSDSELDLICGVYKVYTGEFAVCALPRSTSFTSNTLMRQRGYGEQTSDVSWWPKHQHWTNSGFYTGAWTQWQEEWFALRLQDILAGKASPRSSKAWKKNMAMWRATSSIATKVDAASREFLNRHVVRM